MITGIAAHTLASKRSWTPASAAAAKSSAPRWATSCLFAVTTGLPGREELEHVVARRVDAAHHLRDDGDRRVVADRGEVGRQDAGAGAKPRSFAGVANERAHDAQPVAGRALDVLRVLGEEPVDSRADRSVAEEADPDLDGRP